MNKGMNKSAEEAFIVISTVFLVMIFVIYYSLNSTRYNFENPVDYSNNWDIKVDRDNGIVKMSTNITEYMQGKALMFRTYDSFLNVDIGGNEIYSYDEVISICKTPGSYWHVIHVPRMANGANTLNQTLALTVRAIYEKDLDKHINVSMGLSGDLILSKVYGELRSITISVLLMLAGVLLCIIYSVKIHKKSIDQGSKKELYLGILAILVAIIYDCSLFTFQMVITSGVLQYFIYYVIMMMLPLVLLLYIKEIFAYFDCGIYFYIHTGVVVMFTAMQLLGISEYTEAEPVYVAVFIAESAVVIVDLVREFDKSRVLVSKYEIMALVILAIAVVGNFLQFLNNRTSGTDLMLTTSGVMIYIVVSMYTSMSTVIPAIVNSIENEKLSRIAFIDGSTKIFNRTAFNRDVKNIELEKMFITALDLNNLKYYNDTYGHNVGDELILAAVEVLKDVYGEESVYRIGGDEFVVLKSGIDKETQSKWREELINKSREFTTNNSKQLVLEIACGDASYIYGDSSYEEIYKRADKNMYEHKSLLKSKSTIHYVR